MWDAGYVIHGRSPIFEIAALLSLVWCHCFCLVVVVFVCVLWLRDWRLAIPQSLGI
jgi:hypothetical protein